MVWASFIPNPMRDVTRYLETPEMRPQQIYEELKNLAEKLEIEVKEQNFRTTGIKVKSGLCVVRGRRIIVMNKHNHIRKKVTILAKMPA